MAKKLTPKQQAELIIDAKNASKMPYNQQAAEASSQASAELAKRQLEQLRQIEANKAQKISTPSAEDLKALKHYNVNEAFKENLYDKIAPKELPVKSASESAKVFQSNLQNVYDEVSPKDLSTDKGVQQLKQKLDLLKSSKAPLEGVELEPKLKTKVPSLIEQEIQKRLAAPKSEVSSILPKELENTMYLDDKRTASQNKQLLKNTQKKNLDAKNAKITASRNNVFSRNIGKVAGALGIGAQALPMLLDERPIHQQMLDANDQVRQQSEQEYAKIMEAANMPLHKELTEKVRREKSLETAPMFSEELAQPFTQPTDMNAYFKSISEEKPESFENFEQEDSIETPSRTIAQNDSQVQKLKSPVESLEPAIQEQAQQEQPFVDEDLLKAQQLQNKLEGQHGVARAMSKLLQSVTLGGKNINADLSQYDDLIKRASQPVRNIKDQREQEEVLTKLQTDKAKADPNSPVSKMARDSLSEIAGIAVPEGTSLKQLEVIYPYITQAMNTKAAREDRAFARQQLAYEKEQRRQEKQDDKNYTFVQNLRKEMGQGEGAKVYGAARKSASALAAVKSAISSPSGYKDLMNTYNLGKIADPDSAVREGELKLFGSVGSIPQRMRANFAKFVNGELNDKEQRKAMLKVIEEIHKRNLNDYKNYMKPIYKQADAMGVDREMLDRSFEMEEEQKPSSNSDIHQKAYEWAKANPNDPKAKQILERQGRK
jgi:hypothetical protein